MVCCDNETFRKACRRLGIYVKKGDEELAKEFVNSLFGRLAHEKTEFRFIATGGEYKEFLRKKGYNG